MIKLSGILIHTIFCRRLNLVLGRTIAHAGIALLKVSEEIATIGLDHNKAIYICRTPLLLEGLWHCWSFNFVQETRHIGKFSFKRCCFYTRDAHNPNCSKLWLTLKVASLVWTVWNVCVLCCISWWCNTSHCSVLGLYCVWYAFGLMRAYQHRLLGCDIYIFRYLIFRLSSFMFKIITI